MTAIVALRPSAVRKPAERFDLDLLRSRVDFLSLQFSELLELRRQVADAERVVHALSGHGLVYQTRPAIIRPVQARQASSLPTSATVPPG